CGLLRWAPFSRWRRRGEEGGPTARPSKLTIASHDTLSRQSAKTCNRCWGNSLSTSVLVCMARDVATTWRSVPRKTTNSSGDSEDNWSTRALAVSMSFTVSSHWNVPLRSFQERIQNLWRKSAFLRFASNLVEYLL